MNYTSLLLCLTLAVSAPVMLDQQFGTQCFTDADFAGWSLTGTGLPSSHFFYTCAGVRIFGGYNIFFGDPLNPVGVSRTWSTLAPHYAVQIQMTLYKIDSWTGSTLFISVDGTTVSLFTWTAANGGTSDICGEPSPIPDSINTNFCDLTATVNVVVPHTGSSMTLSLISNLNSAIGSWGFRGVTVTLLTCDESCLTCTSAASCSACDTLNGLSLVGAFCSCTGAMLIQKAGNCAYAPCGQCVAGCTLGYYSTTYFYCAPCNVACSSCNSPLNTAGSCMSCATGYYRSSAALACSSCYSGCASCLSLASTACLSCLYGYFLSFGQCFTTCPPTYYPQESTRSCLTCSGACANCDQFSSCLSCPAGSFLLDYSCYSACPFPTFGYNSLCGAQCPLSTFPNIFTRTCQSCPALCLECNVGTTCFKCQASTFFLSGTCYATCPTLYYNSVLTWLCVLCDPSCQTCTGPTSDDCLSCVAPNILVGSACYTSCPSFTYSALCLFCNRNCLTCSGGSANNCLSCLSPLLLDLNSTTCSSACASGQLVDSSLMTCTSCPPSTVASLGVCTSCSPTCLTCYGLTFLQCSSCNSNSTFIISTCKSASAVVYTPHITDWRIGVVAQWLFVGLISLCALLEIAFTHKSVLLPTVELFQLLSFTYYLSVPMSEATQVTLAFFLTTNFLGLYTLPVSRVDGVPAKMAIQGKSGYYVGDAFLAHLAMVGTGLALLGIRTIGQRTVLFNKVYSKLNPYLFTYLFRLALLDLSLNLFLFLTHFSVASIEGAASLGLILSGLLMLIISLCWKVRPNAMATHLALFYDNELEDAPSLIPSLLNYLSKLPVPLIILLFPKNPTTQTASLLAYFSLYTFLQWNLPYRRMIYRMVVRGCAAVLSLNSFLSLLASLGLVHDGLLEVLWLTAILFLLGVTCMQIITNHLLLRRLLKYCRVSVQQWCKTEAKKTPEETPSERSEEQNQSKSSIHHHQIEEPTQPVRVSSNISRETPGKTPRKTPGKTPGKTPRKTPRETPVKTPQPRVSSIDNRVPSRGPTVQHEATEEEEDEQGSVQLHVGL